MALPAAAQALTRPRVALLVWPQSCSPAGCLGQLQAPSAHPLAMPQSWAVSVPFVFTNNQAWAQLGLTQRSVLSARGWPWGPA